MAFALTVAAAGNAVCSLAVSPSVSGRCSSTFLAPPLSHARSSFSGRALSHCVPQTVSRRAPSKSGVRASDGGFFQSGDILTFMEYDPNEEILAQPVREWPNAAFVAEVLEAFPEKAIANVEEARVLYESGYTYVDVRPALELSEVGKVINSVNVPLYNSKRVYSKAENKKVVQKEENKDFLKQFQKKFPDKKAKLIIACSDAATYSMQALEMLDDAGYENLVALQGGYYAWFRVFDNKLGRRRSGEYAEDFRHDGAATAGIHASGAGFEKMDAIERWTPPSY